MTLSFIFLFQTCKLFYYVISFFSFFYSIRLFKMKDVSNFSSNNNSTSIDGKQIIWTAATRLNAHMKSEPLKRREKLKQPPRLKKGKFNQSTKTKVMPRSCVHCKRIKFNRILLVFANVLNSLFE